MTFRALSQRLLAVVVLTVLGACVSSPETKLASTQYRAALDAYTGNVSAFERAWIAEIDALIDDLEEALASRAVAERIRMLSSDYDEFTNRDWQREVAREGLISLSEAVYSERARVQKFVNWLEAANLPDSQDPQKVVSLLLAQYREEALQAIELQQNLDAAEKQRLQTEVNRGPFGDDVVANSMVKMIITARLARDTVPADIDNLVSVLSALKTAHVSVDQWIQTDVTVNGEDLAALVSAWSSAVGGTE